MDKEKYYTDHQGITRVAVGQTIEVDGKIIRAGTRINIATQDQEINKEAVENE